MYQVHTKEVQFNAMQILTYYVLCHVVKIIFTLLTPPNGNLASTSTGQLLLFL